MRDLEEAKVGDWLAIDVRGLKKLEQVTRVSPVVIQTGRYKFTLDGASWPSRKHDVTAKIATEDEIELWLKDQVAYSKQSKLFRRKKDMKR